MAKEEAKTSALKFPDPPIIAAGALGGPLCMYFVTPARNALTIASKDASLSVMSVFRKAFPAGLRSGWTGGIYPAVAACPQYLCLGPMYHVYASFAGPIGAIVLTGITETTVLYGAETKNAQMAINATGGKIPVNRIQSPFNPWGPGSGINCVRNIVAMSGMRMINEPIANSIEKMAGSKTPSVELASDMAANVCAACMSMPLHMLYSYVATTPELWEKPMGEQGKEMTKFLRNQYFPNGRLSPVILRDAFLRSLYIATAYTMYMQIERAAVKHWPFRSPAV